MLWAALNPPPGAIEKAAGSGLFPDLGPRTQQAFCGNVYTPALLATIVFGGIEIPAMHENRPDVRKHTSHAGAGCAERWKLVFRDSG